MYIHTLHTERVYGLFRHDADRDEHREVYNAISNLRKIIVDGKITLHSNHSFDITLLFCINCLNF